MKKLSVILLLTLSGQTQATLWGKLAGAARTGLSAVRSCQKNLFPKEPQPKNIENLLKKLIDPKFKTAPIVSAETQSLLAKTITKELERTAISLRRDNFPILKRNSGTKAVNPIDYSRVLLQTRRAIEHRLIDDLAIKNIEPLLSEILKQQKKNSGCVFSYFWVDKSLYPPLPKQLAIGIFEETIKKERLPVFSNTALPIIEFEERSKQKELARKYLEKYHSFLITHKDDPQSIKPWGNDYYYSGKSSLIRDIANGIFPSPKKNETN